MGYGFVWHLFSQARAKFQEKVDAALAEKHANTAS
jgi:hypothetical protein